MAPSSVGREAQKALSIRSVDWASRARFWCRCRTRVERFDGRWSVRRSIPTGGTQAPWADTERVTPEALALLGLALGVVVIAGSAVASRTGLPGPVVLVVFGLLASLVPGAPSLNLPPDLVFLVFLPPLVYRASFLTHPKTLRRHATPLALLSVGLVLATATTVAFIVSHLVPGLGFAEGLVLGAVVAPTDPVAAAGIFGRLGAPRNVVDVVEGESLVNDATALVLYALAVQAVVSGPPTVLGAGTKLAIAVLGGVAIGLLTGFAVVVVRARIRDIGLQLLLSLFTPYAAYILAEKVSASGVLAVVTAGVLLGSRSGGIFGSASRLQTSAFWSLLGRPQLRAVRAAGARDPDRARRPPAGRRVATDGLRRRRHRHRGDAAPCLAAARPAAGLPVPSGAGSPPLRQPRR